MPPVLTFCKQAKSELICLSRILNSPLVIGAKSNGYNTFQYFIEPAKSNETRIKIELNNLDIGICKENSKYILGTKISWIPDTMGSRFNFENPNAKGHCCCGKSFYI